MKAIPEWSEVRPHIQEEMTRRKINRSGLATLTGLGHSTIVGVMTKNKDVQWNTLALILEALDLDLRWLADRFTPPKKKGKK